MQKQNANNGNLKEGKFGFEDVINASAGGGTSAAPDGALEPPPPAKTPSPEDVNFEGKLDNYGAMNRGLRFNTLLQPNVNGAIVANAAKPNPYTRIDCPTTARNNWMSGAGHVLKLVDRDMGSLPRKIQPDGTEAGGFTVASENPGYIQGDDSSNSTDPTWNNLTATEPVHAACRHDSLSSGLCRRQDHRFSHPSFAGGVLRGYSTDGGLHDFLRFLEDWSGNSLYYKGSLVSLYYSTHATGTFKYCGYSVYQPPDRNYFLILSSPLRPARRLASRNALVPRCRKLKVTTRVSRQEPTSRTATSPRPF